MNDNILSKNNGKFFTILDKHLGKGAYGDVYVGKNELGKKIAIKCCKFDETGIPNILEACIMKSFIHPTLNNALEIICSNSMLYIIQDYAITDLHQYTSIHNHNHCCTLDELNHIFSSLLQAVSILHHHHIIHCDIKASNVLMYDNNVIKLADFSLATIKHKSFTHTVCTSTHRSLEGFLKTGFDEKLDIWSLGCTFYEIAYQELLFVNQGVDRQYSKKKQKELLSHKSINAILDWAKYTKQEVDLNHYDIPYNSINITKRFLLDDMKPINDMIHQMLMIDSSKRVNAIDLVKNGENPKIICNISKNIPYCEEARVVRYIQQISTDSQVQKMAYDLYKQYDDEMDEHSKSIGCTWIAMKLIAGSGIVESINYPIDTLLQIERKICHHLHFRLYNF